MSDFEQVKIDLINNQKIWLITGVAGFIGSNLLEALLKLNQRVVGLDNFSTGYRKNIDDVKALVSESQWRNFKFIEGDICNYSDCTAAVKGVDYVLHQAALGSVPRSITSPLLTNENNISGFLNMLEASRKEKVDSFTYAASSSTYGDHKALPKREEIIGNPLSPYAVTKYVNELYASVYARVYQFNTVGLRYFNVFGPRQDPNGAYAAVIPKWTSAMINGETISINGDGETSRDFCFVENTIQMNILAAVACEENKNEIYNVALGDRTTLVSLFKYIRNSLIDNGISYTQEPQYQDFRKGDVRHSQACILKAKQNLGYKPKINIEDGIKIVVPWYIDNISQI